MYVLSQSRTGHDSCLVSSKLYVMSQTTGEYLRVIVPGAISDVH